MIAAIAFGATSCGGGDKKEVNTDTIVSVELADSMSVALGAFMGANAQGEIPNAENIDDYIKGYQLIVGHNFSYEELMGMRAGLYVATQFAGLESQGIELNRDLYLQQFRKYIQKENLSQAELGQLFQNYQSVINSVENILALREQMRMADVKAQMNAEILAEEEIVSEEVTADKTEAADDETEEVNDNVTLEVEESI